MTMEDVNPAKKKGSASQPEFSGRLESISISNGGTHFQFDVANKTSDQTYLLDTANQPGFAALAALLSAAYMAGKKVHVKSKPNGDGLPLASEIRVGSKPRLPKVKKVKPVVRVKGPLPEVLPAA
ncbi:MAG: hypothetical protein WCB71_06370 [Aestuariivirga sp.]